MGISATCEHLLMLCIPKNQFPDWLLFISYGIDVWLQLNPTVCGKNGGSQISGEVEESRNQTLADFVEHGLAEKKKDFLINNLFYAV